MACEIFHCGVGSSLWHVGSSLWRAGSRARGLYSLRHQSTVVVARGLSCPASCGILVPRFFTTGPPGKSLSQLFLNCMVMSADN